VQCPSHSSTGRRHAMPAEHVVHAGAVRSDAFDISAYLVQAWDVRNSCKHNGAVLTLSATPVGRGADGVDAMA
jgi:hypothetical protein